MALVLAIPFTATAQDYHISKQDSLVKVLVDRHIKMSKARNTMSGYRVQVFFGPDRNKALEIKNETRKLYRDQRAYLSYQQPNFKIRIGDFRTRLEALKFLRSIQGRYSTAFLVKDDVNFPSF